MERRPRPVGRPERDYEKPPRPKRVTIKCAACGTSNVVWLDDALYGEITKAAAVCGRCQATLI